MLFVHDPHGRRRAGRGRPGRAQPRRRRALPPASPRRRRATTGPTASRSTCRRRSQVGAARRPARCASAPPAARRAQPAAAPARPRAPAACPRACAPTPPARRAWRSRPRPRRAAAGGRTTARLDAAAASSSPSTPAAARNAQRLAAPALAGAERAVTAPVAPRPRRRSPPPRRPTACWSARTAPTDVVIGNVPAGTAPPIAVRLYGPVPHRRRDPLRRRARPGRARWPSTGPGEYTTPAATPRRGRAGTSTSRRCRATTSTAGVVTPCDDPAERVEGRDAARRRTQVSSAVDGARARRSPTPWTSAGWRARR